MNAREIRAIRGRMVFMVFQDPLNSLNPVKKVGDQILEALRLKGMREGQSREADQGEVVQAFKDVRIPVPGCNLAEISA